MGSFFVVFAKRQSDVYFDELYKLKRGQRPFNMLLIFPQLRCFAKNRKTEVNSLRDVDMAREYLTHPVLGSRLMECCDVLLEHDTTVVKEMFDEIHLRQLHISMTTFALISHEDSVFHKVINRFFGGKLDSETKEYIYLLEKLKNTITLKQ